MRFAKKQLSIIAIEHLERQTGEDWPHSLLRRLELRQRERGAGSPELRGSNPVSRPSSTLALQADGADPRDPNATR
jgi:hypothetical protein